MGGKGSGGSRRGAGRKSTLEREIVEAREIKAELVALRELGITLLAEGYPKLIAAELATALPKKDEKYDGNRAQRARQFLIKTANDLMKADEEQSNPAAELIQQWAIQVQGDLVVRNLDSPGEGDIIEAGSKVISERAGG